MVIILPVVDNFLSRKFPQSLDPALDILESYSFIELHSQIFSIYFKLPKFKWPPAEFPVQFLSSMVLFTHKLTKIEWRITGFPLKAPTEVRRVFKTEMVRNGLA